MDKSPPKQISPLSSYLFRIEFEILNESVIKAIPFTKNYLERILKISVDSFTLPNFESIDETVLSLGDSVVTLPFFSSQSGDLTITFYEQNDMSLLIFFLSCLNENRLLPEMHASKDRSDIKITVNLLPKFYNSKSYALTEAHEDFYYSNHTYTYYLRVIELAEDSWTRSGEANLHKLTVTFSCLSKEIGP